MKPKLSKSYTRTLNDDRWYSSDLKTSIPTSEWSESTLLSPFLLNVIFKSQQVHMWDQPLKALLAAWIHNLEELPLSDPIRIVKKIHIFPVRCHFRWSEVAVIGCQRQHILLRGFFPIMGSLECLMSIGFWCIKISERYARNNDDLFNDEISFF